MPAPKNFLRLSQLTAIVSETVSAVFGQRNFWVLADVTSHVFKQGQQFHYFELVEKNADTHVVTARFGTRAWSDGSQKIAAFEQSTGQPFGNEIQVLVLVSIQYHAVYGLQLTLLDIDAGFTLGSLEKQKRAVLQKLLTENPEHVRLVNGRHRTFNQDLSLPKIIQHIAVISAKTSAGFGDFRHALEGNRQEMHFRIDTYFAAVQGEANTQGIVEQLIAIYQSGLKYDAVVIIRGGGAQADLLLFDQYAIGRAIARFPVPVITGIGHQQNETVADMMAHTAVRTPTQAAEMIISHNRAFLEEIAGLERNIMVKAQRQVADRSRQLENLNYKLVTLSSLYLKQQEERLYRMTSQVAARPSGLLVMKRNAVNALSQKAGLLSMFYLRNRNADLQQHVQLIRMMSPAQILKKGFAIVKVKGIITSDPGKIEQGDEISVILAGQELNATVNSKTEHDNSEFDL
jgi:exodeoxyribonuclease VII large subunit